MGLEPVSALLGGVAGYFLKGRKVEPVDWAEVISKLQAEKPVTIKRIPLAASTARDQACFTEAGDFILVEDHRATVPFYIQLNESDESKAPKLNLLRKASIEGPFYRFFVTNAAGRNDIDLFVCLGARLKDKETGVEEVAARLGSPVTLDRRGEVVWMCDFEGGVERWELDGNGGTGRALEWSPDTWRSGGFCMKLTAGSDDYHEAVAEVDLDYIGSDRVGLECSYSVPYGSAPSSFTASLTHYDGSDALFGTIKYSLDDKKLYVGGNEIANFLNNPPYKARSFVTMKVVFDIPTRKYVRAIFGGIEYDVSMYDVSAMTSHGAWSKLVVGTTLEGRSGFNHWCHVDDVIVTRAEP